MYNELWEELSCISEDKRWDFFKKRIIRCSEPKTAKDLEAAFAFMMAAGIAPPKPNETLIIMVHGIRTHAQWHEYLEYLIKKKSAAEVRSVRYGYFDSVRFIFHLYKKKLRHLTQEIRIAKRDFPTHEIAIVAHSFGTFLTLKFLQKNIDFEVDRILFCGAVVNEYYDFERLKNFPSYDAVINCVGCKDYYPVLAKISSIGYGVSGTFGFNRQSVQNVFINANHSGFFTDSIYEQYWLPFLLKGKVVKDPSMKKRPPSPYILSMISLVPGGLLILISLITLAIWLSI